MPGILGKKLGMTRIVQDDGRVIPITVVECIPNTITQVKTAKKDGYPAIVLGFNELKKTRKTKKYYRLREFSPEEGKEYKVGDKVTLEILKDIKEVTVTGLSKGKGFQGVIKRHNFSRGPETHGSHHHREPGAIGACASPARVHKGKKMAGRMGGERVTRKQVPVIYLEPSKNLIGLKGAVPGANKGLVIIKREA